MCINSTLIQDFILQQDIKSIISLTFFFEFNLFWITYFLQPLIVDKFGDTYCDNKPYVHIPLLSLDLYKMSVYFSWNWLWVSFFPFYFEELHPVHNHLRKFSLRPSVQWKYRLSPTRLYILRTI